MRIGRYMSDHSCHLQYSKLCKCSTSQPCFSCVPRRSLQASLGTPRTRHPCAVSGLFPEEGPAQQAVIMALHLSAVEVVGSINLHRRQGGKRYMCDHDNGCEKHQSRSTKHFCSKHVQAGIYDLSVAQWQA